MELTQKMFVTTLLTGVVALADLGAAHAGDYAPAWRTMRPLYAVNFDVGRKRVLSYFLSKNGLCDLTVMVTDRANEPPKGDEIRPLSTARFTTAIEVGKTWRLVPSKAKAFEYACEWGAQTMSIQEVKQVAATSPSAQ